MKIEVFTDGSATTADKPGGWAFVILVDGVKYQEGFGHLAKATNNVAELTAGVEGLRHVAGDPFLCSAEEITLISDSQLVLHFADNTWQCKKFHLVSLTIELRKLYSSLKANTRWVKGHSGDPNNERCDELAKAAREKIDP
jgi:ribonuclease HI